MEQFVAGKVYKYFPIPFTKGNECPSDSCKGGSTGDGGWGSGSRGNIQVMIIKPFVGFAPVNVVASYVQASTIEDTVETGPRMSQLNVQLSVTVPQSCELNAGDIITMDFGDIGAAAFSQAGAGNKPDGVNPQTKTIGIKCTNIDAQTLLTMRLETNSVSGNAVISDNKDLGFIVADKDRNPLTPNNIDSKIPFQLDDNASASVPITAWPVSITGNKPAEGKFMAEGYLRVDFD
ncbi:hypothetical protein EH228_06355 [Erwinia endophytica]|nr:hypothetical protein EH228_06355 [Erwinia endophytica]